MNTTEQHQWPARTSAAGTRFVGLSFLSPLICVIALCGFGAAPVFAQNLGCTSVASNGSGPSTFGPVPCSNSDSGQGSLSKTIIVEDEGGSFPAVFTIGFGNSSQASATLQQLRASGNGSATASPAFYEYTDAAGNGAQIDNPLFTVVTPSGQSSWFNRFVVGGPAGPLQFRITLVVTGTPNSAECVSGLNDAFIRTQVDFNAAVGGAGSGTMDTFDPLVGGSPGLGYQVSACRGVEASTMTGVVTMPPAAGAQAFFLTNTLVAGVSGWAGDTREGFPPPPPNVPFLPNGGGSVDATVVVYIDPITPGATYTDFTGAVNSHLTPPSTVVVPNFVGQSQLGATTAIVSTGLTVGNLTSQFSSSVAAGNVISQSPAAGASVADGSAVNLVISSGPAPVTVPNVVGSMQAAAITAITGAGLAPGTVTNQSSSSVANGVVISESPAAGTSVAAGSPVNLVVSSGPLLGDVNGDGVVNCADLAIIKAAFGKKTGQPGFDSRADVNKDGVVNILDLSAEARLMPAGTTCN